MTARIVLIALLFALTTAPAEAKQRVAEFRGSGNATTAVFRVESPWVLD